jgi:hypothetical protein
VHVYVHGADVETTTLPPSGSSAATTSTAVEQMLRRFENFDPTTAARQVHDQLVARGWDAVVPVSRDGKATSGSSYLRLIFRGSNRKAVLYINTKALVSNAAKQHAVAVKLDGAEVHNGKETYLYHDTGRVQQALAGAEALERWANGEVEK